MSGVDGLSRWRRGLSHRLCAAAATNRNRGRAHLAGFLLECALAVQPHNMRARAELVRHYLHRSRIGAAVRHAQRGASLSPESATFWTMLGVLAREGGETDKAFEYLRHAVDVEPARHRVSQQLVFQEFYRSELIPETIRAAHERWAERYAAPLYPTVPPRRRGPGPGRRLRIGYVSPDWRRHAVAMFSECFLRHHDRSQFDVFCYSCTHWPDARTRELSRLPEHWHDVARESDEVLADRIRRDEIDVLVDLAGHTPGSRALVFARQPAPVQVSFLGYGGTTGIPTIRYRVTDSFADPRDAAFESHWVERLVRLPETAWCFTAPANAPAVASLPAVRKRIVTFGSLSHVTKLSSATLTAWSRVLRAVPDSRLLVIRDSLGDPAVNARILRRFVDCGAPLERVRLTAWRGGAPRLAAYHDIDIALDTFPYNGMTTTCDALYMGVPVVALAGTIHVGRMGVSVLNNVGIAAECLAQSDTDFVAKAARLAANREALAVLRRELRPRMERSSLMDGPRFTQQLEVAFSRLT